MEGGKVFVGKKDGVVVGYVYTLVSLGEGKGALFG